MKRNTELREYMSKKGVKMWEVADALHVCESTFCKHFRYEFSEEKKKEVKNIVDSIARGR